MTACAIGLAMSLLAVLFGLFPLPNAALAILGFVGFGVALGCLDHADRSRYARTSDSINALNRLRVGHYEDKP